MINAEIGLFFTFCRSRFYCCRCCCHRRHGRTVKFIFSVWQFLLVGQIQYWNWWWELITCIDTLIRFHKLRFEVSRRRRSHYSFLDWLPSLSPRSAFPLYFMISSEKNSPCDLKLGIAFKYDKTRLWIPIYFQRGECVFPSEKVDRDFRP